MALAYWIYPASQLVVVRGSGVVTDDEAVALRLALGRDSRFEPTFRELVDQRAATDLMLTRDAIHTVAAVNPYGPGARRAVAAPADLVYGTVRMYQMTRPPAPDEFEVFRELDAALRWLAVTPDELPTRPPDWTSGG